MFDFDTLIAGGIVGASAVARHLPFSRWQPGQTVRILLVGLVGKGNHGGDVRAISMIEGLSLGGGVPAVGVSADERLHNQFAECGQAEYCLSCYDPALEAKLPEVLEHAWAERAQLGTDTAQLLPHYMERVDRMANLVGARVGYRSVTSG